MILENDFKHVEELLYLKFKVTYGQPIKDEEGSEYGAGHFRLKKNHIILRSSKITPKKIGQFVTLWKRNSTGETEPYNIKDSIDLLVINTRKGKHFGQFIFSFDVLKERGIISSSSLSGKRGFRIYPPWDNPTSSQAIKTQAWQCQFFLTLDKSMDINFAKTLYKVV